MKSFFKKMGFHKMDEMELDIAQKAQHIAFIYIVIALAIWSLYESYLVYSQHVRVNSFPSLLLCTTVMVQMISQFFLQKQVFVKGEGIKETSFLKYLVLIVVVVILITYIGVWLLTK